VAIPGIAVVGIAEDKAVAGIAEDKGGEEGADSIAQSLNRPP
jgi:hypothetical protein